MSTLLEAARIALPGRLDPCDLTLDAGRVTMLVGPNGAGKTSLLHALAGIGAATGEVRIAGQDLRLVPPARRIGLLAFLGARRDVSWPLTVRDFVGLAFAGRADEGAVDEVLDSVGISAFADRRTDRLSTGERSRVMLARALAPRARAVLLDEPCANLDPKWQLFAIERLRREAAGDRAVLLSVHDLDLAAGHGDRVIVVDRGKIVADGPPASALSAEVVARVFGVRRAARGRWRRLA